MNKTVFKAGAAMQPLTYPKEFYPACSQFAVCETLYDECYVRVIALSCGQEPVLIFSYDLSDIPEVEDLAAKIASHVGTKEENIMISVTHNHASYCDRGCKSWDKQNNALFRERFLVIEEQASLRAAKEAVESMQHARVGYGEINSYLNDNEITSNSRLGFNPDLEPGIGFSDKTLAIIKFINDNDQVIAVLMNYCCHATYGMGAKADGTHVITGNFTGIASRFVEEYYGNGAVAVWTSGAAGNQHPMLRGGMIRWNYTDGYTGHMSLPGDADLILMEYTGRRHGTDAINCIESITTYENITSLRRGKNDIYLDNQKAVNPQSHGRHERIDYGKGMKSNQPEPAQPAVSEIMVPDPDNKSTLEMEILMIGDNICLIGMGAEPFCQIGSAIKTAVPAEHTVVVTHTPGYVGDNPHAVGYLVDKTSVNAGIDKCTRNLIPGVYDDAIVDNALFLYENAIKKGTDLNG